MYLKCWSNKVLTLPGSMHRFSLIIDLPNKNDLQNYLHLLRGLKENHSISSITKNEQDSFANIGTRIDYNEMLNNIHYSIGKSFGEVYITWCPKCGVCAIGPQSLCLHCSKKEPVPLFSCDGEDCFCSKKYFDPKTFQYNDEKKAKYNPERDITFCCNHKNKEPICGYPIRSTLEIVLSALYHSYGTKITGTRRNEKILSAIHSANTGQLSWEISQNYCSINMHFGEIDFSDIVYALQMTIAKLRETEPLPNLEWVNNFDIFRSIFIYYS